MFRQMFEEKYMRFPGGRAKALTFSYDDGVKADKRLIEILDRHGLKGTFNLNSLLFNCERWHDRMDEEQTYLTFYNRPHEIALHGARHVFLSKVPLPEAVNEIVQNRVYLEGKFNRIVRGMAYAYNGYNAEILNILPQLGVVYARTTHSTHGFMLPQNFLEWHPTCHHTEPELMPLAQKFANDSPLNDFKHREPWLFYIWGHSYEFDDDNNWQIMEDICGLLGGREDIWYATNIEIYEYAQAYRSLVFAMDGERVYNPSAIPVWLEIRGRVYKIEPAQTVCFEKEL